MDIMIDNPASRDLVPLELLPVIDHLTNIYTEIFGSRLQSVYLLGGAVRGEYQPGYSDLDVKAIVRDKEDGEKEKISQIEKQLQGKFNIAKIELDAYDLAKLNERGWLQFYILIDGICMWGEPYEPTLPLPTSGEELAKMLASHILKQYNRVYEMLENMKSNPKGDGFDKWIRIYAKKTIRLGYTMVILKTGRYTQNSKKMIERITKNFPEIAESIARLSQYTNNPPLDIEGFSSLVRDAETVREVAEKYDLKK